MRMIQALFSYIMEKGHFVEDAVKIIQTLLQRMKKMSNITQLVLLLAITTALAILFYAFPASSAANGTALNGTALRRGIGGGTITGSCTAGQKALPIYSVNIESKNKAALTPENKNKNEKYISISFDAAWGAEDTVQILNILDKCNVKTTFFMTGGWVESYPDMVKEIYARGHDLGNHSQSHKQMSKLSAKQQKEEIMNVSASVKELTGYDMFLFRPPYGDYNNTLINTVYSCNYYPIQWSVDSLDWKDYGAENIIKTVTKHKKLGDGAIVLMHNGAKFTAQALETVIKDLQEQGYTLVPISELIIRENFHMDTNGTQIAD